MNLLFWALFCIIEDLPWERNLTLIIVTYFFWEVKFLWQTVSQDMEWKCGKMEIVIMLDAVNKILLIQFSRAKIERFCSLFFYVDCAVSLNNIPRMFFSPKVASIQRNARNQNVIAANADVRYLNRQVRWRFDSGFTSRRWISYRRFDGVGWKALVGTGFWMTGLTYAKLLTGLYKG